MRRPTDSDLFAEEQHMPAMSFGDHIEELRARLILALMGLVAGVFIAFIPWPPGWQLTLGQWVFDRLQAPAQEALEQFRREDANRRAAAADKLHATTEPFEVEVPLLSLKKGLQKLLPDVKLESNEAIADQSITISMKYRQSDWIEGIHHYAHRTGALIMLNPLETFMIYFMVCLVTGLVVASGWVFYQIWAFIAAGLYKHERYYVMKFLPFSLVLFLAGVLLCFFLVMPFTLKFLLDFNVWLNIEPTLRLSDWMGFATFLPLVFGICFQTPLVMLVLERIGVFTAADYRSKRKYALLIIVIAAAAITPTGDPMTMSLLAGPMYALYELGIRLIPVQRTMDVPARVA